MEINTPMHPCALITNRSWMHRRRAMNRLFDGLLLASIVVSGAALADGYSTYYTPYYNSWENSWIDDGFRGDSRGYGRARADGEGEFSFSMSGNFRGNTEWDTDMDTSNGYYSGYYPYPYYVAPVRARVPVVETQKVGE